MFVSAAHQMVFEHIKPEAFFEALPEATLIINKSGEILALNSRVKKLFVREDYDLLGKNIETFLKISLNKLVELSANFDQIERSFFSQSNHLLKSDGTKIIIETSVAPFCFFYGEDCFLITVRLKEGREKGQPEINPCIQLEKKDFIIKELNHRFKNTLQTIASLINLQLKTAKNFQAKEAICDMRGRVQAILSAYEHLEQMSDFPDVGKKNYLDSLLSGIASQRGVESGISISSQIQNVSMGVDDMIRCAIIINELIYNSIKHAFKGRQEGEISVSFERLLSGQNKLYVSDNGIGVLEPISSLQDCSIGLRLIKGLVAEINGQLSWSSGHEGTKAAVVWPV